MSKPRNARRENLPSKEQLQNLPQLPTREQLEATGMRIAERKKHNYNWTPTANDLSRIEHLAGIGLNEHQIAEMIGVSVESFKNTTRLRTEDHISAISDAIKRGLAKGTALVVNAVFEQAKEGSFAHAAFWLNNKAGWINGNSKHELTGPDGGPIQVVIGPMQGKF